MFLIADNKKTEKLVLTAMMTAIALAMFVIELQIPSLTRIPAVKLGLANVVTLFLLYLGGNWKKAEVLTVLIARIILGALVTGQLTALIFSGSGGILAMAFMLVSKHFFDEKFIPMVSVFGAVGHNIGQLIAACLFYGSTNVLYYFPVLMISGIISGLLTGYAVYALFRLHPSFISYLRNAG